MRKKILALCTSALLALGLVAVGVAAPASAHTADAQPTVSCETDGTYTVTWTYIQTNTPNTGKDSGADVKVISHSAGTLASSADNGVSQPQIFLNEHFDHAANAKSNQHRVGNWTETFTQSGIPGTATSASVGIQTDWLGWGATETDRTVTLPGTCAAPPLEAPSGDVVFVDGICDTTTGVATANSATLTLDGKTTAAYTFNGGAAIPVAAGFFDNLAAGDYVVTLTGEDGTTIVKSHTYTAVPAPCVVAPPANPDAQASIVPSCGKADVTLTNPLGNAPTGRLTASFVVYVDGNFYGAYAVAADQSQTVNITFPEDSGLHKVVVETGPAFGSVKLAEAKDIPSDCIPPAPIDCLVTNAVWTTEDVAPVQTANGFLFQGPSAAAINTYQRATGNLQGLSFINYTINEVNPAPGFAALVVIEVDPNTDLDASPGVNHYATISSAYGIAGAGNAAVGVNDVYNGLWYTSKIAYNSPGGQGNPISFAAITALMPNNTLLSAPSLHLQTSSNADSKTVVSGIASDCGTFDLTVKPADVPSSTSTDATDCTTEEVVTTKVDFIATYSWNGATWVLGAPVETGRSTTSRPAIAAELNAANCPPPVTPVPKVTTTVKEAADCTKDTVSVETTVTTETFTYDAATRTWVKGADDVKVTNSTRPQTAVEKALCPLVLAYTGVASNPAPFFTALWLLLIGGLTVAGVAIYRNRKVTD